MNVEHEIGVLIAEMTRLGAPSAAHGGKIAVKFGTIVNDERCGDLFEALVGTLRAAKKRKVVDFEGEMLLQGAHDNVDVVLLRDSYP